MNKIKLTVNDKFAILWLKNAAKSSLNLPHTVATCIFESTCFQRARRELIKLVKQFRLASINCGTEDKFVYNKIKQYIEFVDDLGNIERYILVKFAKK